MVAKVICVLTVWRHLIAHPQGRVIRICAVEPAEVASVELARLNGATRPVTRKIERPCNYLDRCLYANVLPALLDDRGVAAGAARSRDYLNAQALPILVAVAVAREFPAISFEHRGGSCRVIVIVSRARVVGPQKRGLICVLQRAHAVVHLIAD